MIRKFIVLMLALLIGTGLFAAAKYDIVIRNGRVIDGTGNPYFLADVAIKGDKIVKIGRITERGKLEIDAKGMVVSPGFIDVHTHVERRALKAPFIDNYLRQGVTTVIAGNCGSHTFPLRKWFAELENNGIAINYASLAGHNTIRRKVMGLKNALPTKEELDKMKALLEDEMRAGAMGLSTGLAYMPGVYSNTEELVELASVVAKFGGVYATHLRDQGEKIKEAIEEAIEIGERNGITVQISHIKLASEKVWGKYELIIKPVEEARARGVEVYLDQYPYTATSSGFSSSLTAWALEGGIEKLKERVKDPKLKEEIKKVIIKRRLTSIKGRNPLRQIYIASYSLHPEYEGKNLEEILIMQKKKPTVDNAAELILEIVCSGDAQGVFFQMDEKDVHYLFKLPYLMVASDGGVQIPGKGVPHPRNYGTFPKVLGRFVRELKLVPLHEAIRKMTSLPAQAFKLRKRGLLREGMFADVVIFDPEKVIDKATFSNPHQYPEGIEYVIVNGKIVIEKGKRKKVLPGRVLRRGTS